MQTSMTLEEQSQQQQEHATMIKLRDTCDACANSKLKCTKEKPTCSRCAKKGISCTYTVSKRKGRKSESESNQSTTQARQRGASDANSPSLSSPATHQVFVPLSRPDMLLSAENSFSINDYLEQWGSSTNETSMSRTSSGYPSLFSESTLPMANQLPDLISDCGDRFPFTTTAFTPDHTQESDQVPQGTVDSNNDGPNLVGSLPFFRNPVATPALSSSTESMITAKTPTPSENKVECRCMLQVMRFVKQIFYNTSHKCNNAEAVDHHSPVTNQSLFSTNRKTIEAVSGILDCSCAQDGFILVIASLIILRLLQRYVDATQSLHLQSNKSEDALENQSCLTLNPQLYAEHENSSSTDAGGLSEEDPGYMMAQRILSELHLVQRLVRQLSIQLHQHGSKSNGPGEIARNNTSLALPLGLFYQLDIDIRTTLKSLAGGVVSILRRE